MSVFVSVASLGSFSAASRALRMPLPTVSRKVSEIEAHLDARLLLRSTRKLTLTDAGRSYLADCKRILEDIADAERVASGAYHAPQGELVVTAPVVFGRLHLVPLLARFLEAQPKVDVRLVLADRTLSLVDDDIDVSLRIGVVPDGRLVAVRIGDVRHVVCASPEYLRRRGVPKSPEQLRAHDCVTFAGWQGTDAWSFGNGVPVHVRSRLEVNHAEAAIDAAIAGIGFTRVLSYQVAEAVRVGHLARVLKRFEPAPIPVSLLYRAEMRVTAKLRAFVDFAGPYLRARLRE